MMVENWQIDVIQKVLALQGCSPLLNTSIPDPILHISSCIFGGGYRQSQLLGGVMDMAWGDLSASLYSRHSRTEQQML